MSRRKHKELLKDWKIPVEADLAGKIEYVLSDPLASNRPKYGARVRLIDNLLRYWLDWQSGKPPDQCQELPSIELLRSL